jgi:hypothetical protein
MHSKKSAISLSLKMCPSNQSPARSQYSGLDSVRPMHLFGRCFGIHKSNLLKAWMVVTTYNPHVRLLSPGPWLVGTTKVYPGVGADIVMESITLTELGRRQQSGSSLAEIEK